MACIDKEQLDAALFEIVKDSDNAVVADIPAGKDIKFDSSKITRSMLAALFTGTKVSETALNTVTDIMGNLGKKLNGLRSITLKNIELYVDAVKSPEKVVPYNIALKELFDSQKGEHDKMLKTKGIESITTISDDGIMNVATARSASVIGRKYLYTIGIRLKSTPENRLTPLQVEKMYNKVGMEILSAMEKDGLVDISKGQVINDYVTKENDRRDYKVKYLTTTVARPKLSAIIDPKVYERQSENIKAQLQGVKLKKRVNVISDITTMVNGVNNALIPPYMSVPLSTAADLETQAQNDYTPQSETAIEARRLFHENPVQINERMLPYFKHLSEQWDNSDMSFEAFLYDQMGNSDLSLFRSFGITPEDLYNPDLKDSISGRNKSKTTPLQDLLEQINILTDGSKAKDLFMNYNYVRNARLNMDNSVLNAQGSQYVRHLVTSGEQDLDLNDNEVAVHFLDSLMEQSEGLVKGDLTYENLSGKEPNTELESLLKLYEKAFVENTDGTKQLKAITNIKSKGNPIVVLDALGGIYDLRNGLKNGGIVTTRFNTKPDATASGGSITLNQAIGSNSQVLELVKSLGLIKGGEITLDDVYGLLSNKLNIITDTLKEGQEIDLTEVSEAELTKASIVKDLLDSGIYNSMRDLSKDPTMTFIYNQGETGAIQTISEAITDKLLTNLNDKNSVTYIGKLLGIDNPTTKMLQNKDDIKKDLIAALSDKKAVVPFLHKQLSDAVEPYIKDRKKTITDLYTAATKLQKEVKILPAIAVMDGKENTAENRAKYGMPLSKKQNIIHPSENDQQADLITIEERNNETTALVNTTHGMDNAILSIAMVRAVKIFKELYPNEPVPGAIPVHDEVISSAKFNTIYQAEYIKAFKEVISEYSVEAQLLGLIKELDPKNPIIAKYETKVEAAIKAKQEAMLDFNEEPGRVFGNHKGTYNIEISGKPTPPNDGGKTPKAKKEDSPGKAEKTTEPKPKETPTKNVRGKKLHENLKILSEKSPIIRSFLKNIEKLSGNRIGNSKDGFKFRTETDYVSIGSISPITKDRVDMENNQQHYKELIEHEIVHAYTAGYIQKQLNVPVEKRNATFAYINKAVDKLEQDYMNILEDKVSEVTLDRLEYIFSANHNKATQIAEFISVMKAETKVADEIYAYLNVDKRTKEAAGKNIKQGTFSELKRKIKDLVKYVTHLLKNEPLDEVTTKALFSSINDVVEAGAQYKYDNYKEARIYEKEFDNLFANSKLDTDRNYTNVDPTLPEAILGRSLNMLNETTNSLLVANAERVSKGLSKKLDGILDANFPVYADVRSRIIKTYDSSQALQALFHYMKVIDFKGKEDKNKLLSLMHNINEERNSRENDQMTKIHNLTRDFDEEGKKELFDLIHKVPLHDYLLHDMNYKSKKDIVNNILQLSKELTKEDLLRVDGTVSLIVDNKVTNDSMYNVGNHYDPNSETAKKVQLLIALKTLQKNGLIDSVLNLRDNHIELYNVIKDNSLALRALTYKIADMSPKGALVSNTLIKENFGGNKEFKAISLKDKKRYEFTEATGWKIVRQPTKSNPGVVVRDVIDNTFLEGLGVSNDLVSSDINVPQYMVNEDNLVNSNIVKVGDSYKLILTHEEKLKAGLVEDIGSTLVKSTAGMIATDDSQVIRNELMKPALRSVITSLEDPALDDVLERIDNEIVDHPWFIKIDEDNFNYSDLPAKIQANYKPIQQDLTSINNFNKEVTLVRKDIRAWLVGGKSASLFENPKMQRLSKITKEVISGAKIGMVITNPKKLAIDAAANNAQLAMLGVPATKIATYSKDVLKGVDYFVTTKNTLVQAKMEYLANPNEESEKAFDKAKEELKQSELYTAYTNGFMNSLSSDILNNNVDTTEGLQSDIHKVLKYMLTSNKTGEANTLHNIISAASKYGMQGEHILNGIGKIVSNFNTDKEVEKYLKGVSQRITDIKDNDDMVNYLSQFTISPNSEIVKAGTWFNDVIDMTSREVYRRHLIDVGVDPKKAIEKAIAFMPDYKENMPVGLKTVSDYGILMFPSFFLRTFQPATYLLRKKLIGVGIEEQVQALIGQNIETVFDTNLYTKLVDGQFLHSPTEYIGVGSVLPTNLFNF